jgi:hypothetical protein
MSRDYWTQDVRTTSPMRVLSSMETWCLVFVWRVAWRPLTAMLLNSIAKCRELLRPDKHEF